ncbi:MAG: ankyrin repeat domain-containing protein [Chloroflexota bacterium]|nr:ankyrin repeat domain-containing protein [Chloroflexota bacterium]
METKEQLFAAIRSGDQERIVEMLDGDPGLAKAKTEKGVSAVLTALYHGKAQIADSLIPHAEPLDIFEASAAGQVDRVTHLLQESPELANAVAPDGFSPLGLSAFFRHPAVAHALVGAGADVNRASSNAMKVMPLHSSVASGQLEISQLLLAHGAHVNATQADDYAPLHEAAQNGDLHMARLLLRYGADPNAPSVGGKTAHDIAREGNHQELAALLEAQT